MSFSCFIKICLYLYNVNETKKQLKIKKMRVFAKLSNGDQTQIEVKGNQKEILNFIASYEGDDLGNDLILQDFVTDFEETGVIIYAK